MHLYGSLMEVMSQLDLALDLNFIDNENYKRLEEMIKEEARVLSGYRASLLDRASKLINMEGNIQEVLDTRGALRCVRFESGNVGVLYIKRKRKARSSGWTRLPA